jgi:hypothetical protein
VHTSTLKDVLQDEARCLNDFAARQKSMQAAISRRMWTELDKEVAELKALAEKIEILEDGRASAYKGLRKALQARDREDFLQVVSRLPAADREELVAQYRRLKAAVIRVKASAGLLAYYVRSLSETLRVVLDEMMPHRKGRIYSRSGRTKQAGDESLLLHHNA